MVSAYEAMEPLIGGLVRVPATPQIGICNVCHSSVDDRWDRCYACNAAKRLQPPEVIPITMEVGGGLIHDHLRQYKDSRTEAVRARMGMRLAGLVAIFFANHGACVGEWDVVTCVPSPARNAPEAIVRRVGLLAGDYVGLLVAHEGEHERALSSDRFSVTQDVQAKRVLLIDDTFTSGSAIFSAVSALRRAGAEVVGPVVIGRFVNLGWAPSTAMLSWLAESPWEPQQCVRCGGARREGQIV